MYNDKLKAANDARKKTYVLADANFNAAMDGRGDGILVGHHIQPNQITQAARTISGKEDNIWLQSQEMPYPVIRRVIMLLMHDDGYTDRQIGGYLNCSRSNVTFQRGKCLYEITGKLADKIVVAYYRQFRAALYD